MPITSIIQGAALLYVVMIGILALNKMGPATPHDVRYGYIALVAGAVAGLASSFAARDIFECIFAVGVALYMAVDRRKAKAST